MRTSTIVILALELTATAVCAGALCAVVWIEHTAVTSMIKILGLL
jgi:hypothetical protein